MPEEVAVVDEVIMDDLFSEEAEPTEPVSAEDSTEPEEEEVVVEESDSKVPLDKALQEQLLAVSSELRELRTKNQDLESRINAPPQAAPKSDEKELTDADLIAIISENRDKPDVMLRVFKHVAEQTATGIADDKANKVIKDQTYNQWAGKMTEVNDSVVQADKRLTDGAFKSSVDKVIKQFSLNGHPAAEMIGAAVVTYAQMLAGGGEKEKAAPVEDRKEKGKLSLGKKGDTSAPSKKNGVAKLTPEQAKFCKDQNIDPALYAKFVR